MNRTYLVVIGKCVNSNFSGHAPDLPGCVSAGNTMDEMTAMMREALELHLEGLVESGEAVPEATTTQIEFKPEDFEDVEYFVIRNISVNVPEVAASHHRNAHQAA